MTILLIDNYDSFSFNLVQALREISTARVRVVRNDRITLSETIASKPEAIVISPGPGHPANGRDFGINTELIQNQHLINCPILGICLGHQGIIHSFGGSIVQANRIMHGKPSTIKLIEESTIFRGCSNTFAAMRYHSLIAIDEALPGCLKVTARDVTTETIMAVEHKTRPIYGLQFHPESIGTPDGKLILTNFVNSRARHASPLQREDAREQEISA